MTHRLATLALLGLVALAPAARAISPDRALSQLRQTAWTAREGVPREVELRVPAAAAYVCNAGAEVAVP